jgi:hypothetical protein
MVRQKMDPKKTVFLAKKKVSFGPIKMHRAYFGFKTKIGAT